MSSRDLEKEMSKFEAELSKLTSSTFSAPAKPKISIQMPTSFTSQFVQQQQQLQQQQQQQASSAPLPSHAPPLPPQPPAFNPPSIQRQTMQQQPPGSGVKRDSSGKPIGGASHQPASGQHQHPRPSGEASYNDEQKAAKKPGFSGAAGAGGSGGGGKPQNPNKNKSKKLLRSAGGEVWEDTTLNEWDPGIFI